MKLFTGPGATGDRWLGSYFLSCTTILNFHNVLCWDIVSTQYMTASNLTDFTTDLYRAHAKKYASTSTSQLLFFILIPLCKTSEQF